MLDLLNYSLRLDFFEFFPKKFGKRVKKVLINVEHVNALVHVIHFEDRIIKFKDYEFDPSVYKFEDVAIIDNCMLLLTKFQRRIYLTPLS